jgi:hypothetical protein
MDWMNGSQGCYFQPPSVDHLFVIDENFYYINNFIKIKEEFIRLMTFLSCLYFKHM